MATPSKPWEYNSFVQVSSAITKGRAAREQHRAVMSVLLGLIPSFVLPLYRRLVPPTPWVCEVRGKPCPARVSGRPPSMPLDFARAGLPLLPTPPLHSPRSP